MLRFETSKAHFVAFKTLMSTLFETPVLFSIFTFHWDLQNESLDRERTEKTFRETIFERHYFICLQNKCMRQCMTGLRTDVRTYGHDVITKFSELHGLLPFSLTNGAPQAAFGRWSSAITLIATAKPHTGVCVGPSRTFLSVPEMKTKIVS